MAEQGTEDGIQKIHCETADDMLDYLRPSNDRWLVGGESGWLFRGHQREDWKLEPSVLRDNAECLEPFRRELHHESRMAEVVGQLSSYKPMSSYKWKHGSKTLGYLCEQMVAELKAIYEFAKAVDDAGLPVPDDTNLQLFRSGYDNFLKQFFILDSWRPRYLESDTVALAQHHGIPTRLLDWTKNPYVAAFFAANGEWVGETENIAVWALRYWVIGRSHLHLFEPRRSRIGYLHAQKGLFIYDAAANQYYAEHGKWRTFETVVADLNKNSPEEILGFEPTRDWLRNITLPADCAKDLLLRLKAHEIERQFLMPTYDNVAAAFLERLEAVQQEWDTIYSGSEKAP